LHVVDSFLSELWTMLESMDFYRGNTTLIMTTDHGRGQTPEDWVEHEEGIAGSEKIWAAFIGPDTPDVGIASQTPTVHQADIASTVLAFFGLAAEQFDPQAGPEIELAFTQPTEKGTP
jgi:arylsulfatase A-like enzyme